MNVLLVFLTYFNLSLYTACFCLNIGAILPPTTPSRCGAKTHNLRTVTLCLFLAFHVLSCVTLIKCLNLSFLIWTMGTMMIIPPLDACVPGENKWPWEGFLGSWVWNKYELFCHLGRRKSSVCKLWLPSPRLTIDSSQMTSISEPWHRTLTELMLLFSGVPEKLMITGSDCSLPSLTSKPFLVNYF